MVYVFMAMCMDVFMVMCFWMCIYGYVFLDGCMDVLYGWAMCMDIGCVCGYVFLDMDVFLAMCMDIGSRSSARPGSSISGLTSPWGPFPSIGTYSSTRPISANFGTYSSTRPISSFTRPISQFGSYSFTRPISFWMTLRIFPIFLRQKWKNLPQYVVSNKFF
jgi:hypothetical protein